MKKLNLGIKFSKPFEEDGKKLKSYEISIRWIKLMVQRAVNKPKFDPRTNQFIPTAQANMDIQTKFTIMVNMLMGHKEGIAELEEDIFKFLDEKFSTAELPLQEDTSEILTAIQNRINEAKITEKDRKKK